MKTINPELAKALAADPSLTRAPPPPPEGVSPQNHARQLLKTRAAPFVEYYRIRLPPVEKYTVTDNLIPVEGDEINARFLRPVSGDATYPVMVWFHGGGWMRGDISLDDNNLRTICVELQLAIVNVEYRLAPENPFPVPFQDCYDALRWVANNAASLGVSLAKGFLVGGDSAGGNLAAAVALKARDDPIFAERPITGQYLREPSLVHPLAWPEKRKLHPRSWEENKDALFLSSERMLVLLDTYGGPSTDDRVSPLLATSHVGLPPAYIQVMHLDVLNDDGIAYERALRESGVATKLIAYDGMFHSTHYMFPALKMSIEIDRDAREGLKWLLGTGVDI